MGIRGCQPRHTDKHVVKVYKESSSLLEAGRKLGLSATRVHQIVTRAAPQVLRPQGKRGAARSG